MNLADVTFVTFIQPSRRVPVTTPAGIVVDKTIPEMAVFAAISPRPQGRKGQQIMSTATASLEDWMAAEAEADHYVGVPDKLAEILGLVTRQHLQTLRNARELIVQ